PRTSPPPVRGQQRLPADAREGRTPDLGHLGGEAARGDRRAAGSSLVRGRPVPSRVPLAAVAAPPALRRLRPRGARAPARVKAVAVGALRIGPGQPLALIGGPCAIENEKHALGTAARPARIAAADRPTSCWPAPARASRST